VGSTCHRGSSLLTAPIQISCSAFGFRLLALRQLGENVGGLVAETKAIAELAFDAFIESYTPKYHKAADCLSKDRDALLAFYDLPAEHWKHCERPTPLKAL
jgi:hypothetical protein